jgi:NTP pyrophosphatase (non-canonical NTP hydrolase)
LRFDKITRKVSWKIWSKNLENLQKKGTGEQFHSPKNLAMALVVEAGEIVEHFQWLTQEQSKSLPPDKLEEIKEEIADVMIFLTNLADRLGIDPLEAAKDKIEKNKKKSIRLKRRREAQKNTMNYRWE